MTTTFEITGTQTGRLVSHRLTDGRPWYEAGYRYFYSPNVGYYTPNEYQSVWGYPTNRVILRTPEEVRFQSGLWTQDKPWTRISTRSENVQNHLVRCGESVPNTMFVGPIRTTSYLGQWYAFKPQRDYMGLFAINPIAYRVELRSQRMTAGLRNMDVRWYFPQDYVFPPELIPYRDLTMEWPLPTEL